MPKRTTTAVASDETTSAKWLRPYIDHGVDFNKVDGSQATGTCPFCGKDKFSVKVETGIWRCWSCQTGTRKGGGNIYTFIREVWKQSGSGSGTDSIAAMRKDRGTMFEPTMSEWGVRISATTGEPILPAYNHEGKLVNLYRYAKPRPNLKKALLSTSELHAGVYGYPLYDPHKPVVWLTKAWDAMVLWEMLRNAKRLEDGSIVPTANEEIALAASMNVLAIPGENVFQEAWLPLFEGKIVYLAFDSDHPKPADKGGGLQGLKGMKRTAQMLARSGGAAALYYVDWSNGTGEGYDPSKPSGYDVRDLLTSARTVEGVRGRVNKLAELCGKVKPIPPDWIEGRTIAAAGSGGTEIECAECTRWDDLLPEWRHAMKMTPGHVYALATMLAISVSTRVPGAQLWCIVISPAASGKTSLVEGLAVNRKWTYSMSKFTGLFSGYDDGTDKDYSQIPHMIDKTFIIKEAANLVTSKNRDELIAELTDVYDRTSRSKFKTKKSKDYHGTHMSGIICGTPAVRQMENAEMGSRFFICSIMNEISDDLEDAVLFKASRRTMANMGHEVNGTVSSQYDPELLRAMQLTGGYVGYLREHANELLGLVHMKDEYADQCIHFGRFVAFMRARPSKVQDEIAAREMATRVVEQMTKLAVCYAVVLNKPTVDADCMRWVRQIAIDSSWGKTLNVVKFLHQKRQEALREQSEYSSSYGDDDNGVATRTLNTALDVDEKAFGLYRAFLCKIGVLEKVASINEYDMMERVRLTPKIARLYDAVITENY